jgi:hypothetical protein
VDTGKGERAAHQLIQWRPRSSGFASGLATSSAATTAGAVAAAFRLANCVEICRRYVSVSIAPCCARAKKKERTNHRG